MAKIKNVGLYLLLPTLFFMSYLCQAQTKQKVLVVMDAGYPPYSYEKNGRIGGIYIHIAQYIFDRMGEKYQIQIKPMPWKRALDATKEGEAFGIIPPYENIKLRPWLKYSEPLLEEQLALFCKNPKDWPQDIQNIRVAINYGFQFNDTVRKMIDDFHMKKLQFKDNEQSINEVIHGKSVDCHINDEQSVHFTLKQMEKPIGIIYKVKNISSIFGYLGYVYDEKKFPFAKDFIKEFNEILINMKKNGMIGAFIKKGIENN